MSTTAKPTTATPAAVVLDCAEPARLAEFYATATGWAVSYSDDDFAYVGEGPIQLGFQRVAGYRGPDWPDDAKHAHLDLKVDDAEAAAGALVAAGATRPDFQPGDGKWIVLRDPEGHPFCLTTG